VGEPDALDASAIGPRVRALAQWNFAVQAAQFRRHFFDMDDLLGAYDEDRRHGEISVTFVPRTRAR
jgi:hypothetical protein